MRGHTEASQSGSDEFQRFAANVEHDGAAVRVALSLPYAHGQVEGPVNRLKVITRMAYGRATFDLLRLPVIPAAGT